MRGVDRKHNAHSPVAACVAARRGTYLERTMQSLGVVDYFLLASSIVYFGLLLMRRI